MIIHYLTHWGRVTHICVSKLTTIGSDNGLSPGWSQAIYLNQCWNIVNSNLRNKLQWNFKGDLYSFIQVNAFENVVWKMAAIFSRPQCVNWLWLSDAIRCHPSWLILVPIMATRHQAITWTNVHLSVRSCVIDLMAIFTGSTANNIH